MTDLACKYSLKEGDIMVWIALKEQELERVPAFEAGSVTL